jgi:flagellar biosynthesis component FlhA
VTPISLEVGSGLVRLVDPKLDGGKFLFEDIPAMRNSIESSTGVRVPGIDVRGSASSPDRYVIQLDEIPMADGVVRVGSKYSTVSPADLAAAGVVGDSMIESSNTMLGRPGQWCSPAQGEALARAGLSVLSETQFVLTHVDQILRQHLDVFIGVQELKFLLVELKKKDPVAAAHTSALNDRRFFVMFARVLRALAREQVPIADWVRILETVQRVGIQNLDEVVSQVRLTLRDKLPGNQEIVEYVAVPTDWQDRIHGDPSVFNASPFDAHGMLVVIRGLLGKRQKPVALVTPTTSLRTFVRRLIEFEFPAVAVLWRDEVLHPERLAFADGTGADGIPASSVAGVKP